MAETTVRQDPPMHRGAEEGKRPGIVHLFGGMVVAPFAWATHLLVAYSLSAHACYPTDRALATPVWPHVRTIVIGATGAAWLLLAVGCAVAWSNWTATRGPSKPGPHRIIQTGDGRARFMALCGLLVSGGFALALLFSSVGAFIIPDCGP